MQTLTPPGARPAYAALAAHYESFTRDYDHETWLGRLEALARRHGLAGRQVLDVACGTGKSLRPLLALGYEGAGCDLSPEMLDVARSALPGVDLWEADMRDLPPVGGFDWVTCLDDALNYLLGDGDLALALGSIGAQLRPGGLLTFDLNTLGAHREGFDATWVVEDDDRYLCWQGRGCDAGPGEPGAADIDIFCRDGRGCWMRTLSRHEQRWWSEGEVLCAARGAGLELLARYGQSPGARLEVGVDESRHTKSVFFLRRPAGPIAGGGGA